GAGALSRIVAPRLLSCVGVFRTPSRGARLAAARRGQEEQRAFPMATFTQTATSPRQASFRHRSSGAVVRSGAFHDVGCLPGGEDADLDQWEAGFTDREGRFYDREEAARLVGVRGRLEAESYFAGA